MILQSHPSDAQAWVMLSAPQCALALPSSALEQLPELADRLAGDDGFRAALELLVAGGISRAPSFALLDGDSAVARVVLRGEATLIVTSQDPDAAELTMTGAGMATWSERVLEGARSLRLQVPGSTWTVRLERAAAAAAAEPEPEPEPEPAATEVKVEVAVEVAETTLAPGVEARIPIPVFVAAPPAHADEAAVAAAPDPEPYDFLFGDTIYRTQAGASVRIPNPDPGRPGDHDGHTMLAADLGVAGHVSAVQAPPSEDTVVAPIPGYVPAVPSAAPAQAAGARVGAALQLEWPDGRRESLGSPVIIGRSPNASAASSLPTPRLITIEDDKDISRSHLRVAVEGDAAVVTDLGSKNGTVIKLPGGSPRKLRAGEPTVLLAGTLIDLGGGVTFTVRED